MMNDEVMYIGHMTTTALYRLGLELSGEDETTRT